MMKTGFLGFEDLLPLWNKISINTESMHLENFILIGQSNFIPVESNSKKYWACILYVFFYPPF